MTRRRERLCLAFFALLALLLRLVLAYVCPHYPEAMADWAERLYAVGPGAFYSEEVQWPYPPLYLYLLWGLQAVIELLRITEPQLRMVVLQLPPILCDVAGGFLVYRVARRYQGGELSLLFALIYLFNPAAIHNSAVWGQTDGCFTLLIGLMCAALVYRRLGLAYLCYGAALLVKQQSLSFAPVLIAGIVDQVFLRDFSWRRVGAELGKGCAVIAGMLLLCLPFGLREVLGQYLSVQDGMPYVSVNAYNFWTLVGRNWARMDTTFLRVPCRVWGIAAIVLITLLSLLLSWRLGGDTRKYPLLGASLIIPVFCAATGMHERYLLSGLLLLLVAYVCDRRLPLLLLYLVFTALQLANTAAVYAYAMGSPRLPELLIQRVVSAGVVLATLALYLTVYGCFWRREEERERG